VHDYHRCSSEYVLQTKTNIYIYIYIYICIWTYIGIYGHIWVYTAMCGQNPNLEKMNVFNCLYVFNYRPTVGCSIKHVWLRALRSADCAGQAWASVGWPSPAGIWEKRVFWARMPGTWCLAQVPNFEVLPSVPAASCSVSGALRGLELMRHRNSFHMTKIQILKK